MELPRRCGDWLDTATVQGSKLRLDTTSKGWGLLLGHQRGLLNGHLRGLSHGHGQSVGDLSGATVAGAWVLADASAGTGAATEPAEHATGLDYLRASYPHGSFGAASRLPHRLGAGESGQLFILWDIVDCSRLVQGQRAQIELTSILGTGTQQELPDWAGPEFALSNTTETGACRTP